MPLSWPEEGMTSTTTTTSTSTTEKWVLESEEEESKESEEENEEKVNISLMIFISFSFYNQSFLNASFELMWVISSVLIYELLQMEKLVTAESKSELDFFNATFKEEIEMPVNVSVVNVNESSTEAPMKNNHTVTGKPLEKVCNCPVVRNCMPPVPVVMLERQVKRITGQLEECDKLLQVKFEILILSFLCYLIYLKFCYWFLKFLFLF